MNDSAVTTSQVGDVALVQVDDGKVNALTPGLLEGLLGALDAAEAGARAVVLAGRPGVFSAGLDLKVMSAGGPPSAALLSRAGDVFVRLATFPRPVVAACTGHAVAAGAVMLLCSDIRVCSAGDFRIGLNEVAIGIPLPELVVDLARARLSPRHFTLACNTGRLYAPEEAVDVGFLDTAGSPDATDDAVATAAELAGRLDAAAFAATRRATVRVLAEAIGATQR